MAGGKDFVSQSVDIYKTVTELTGLDSTTEIDQIYAKLEGWKNKMETDGSIDIAGEDMISLPELSVLQDNLGFNSMDIADFPSP